MFSIIHIQYYYLKQHWNQTFFLTARLTIMVCDVCMCMLIPQTTLKSDFFSDSRADYHGVWCMHVYAYVPVRVFPGVLQTVSVTVKQMPSIHLCMLLGNKLLDSLKVRNIALCVCYLLHTMCKRLWCCVSEWKMTAHHLQTNRSLAFFSLVTLAQLWNVLQRFVVFFCSRSSCENLVRWLDKMFTRSDRV